MQAVVGSSTGQLRCVKWTRGLGQMVFDGLGGCGGWAAYVVYGMWHSDFGTYRRERCAPCAVRTTWCLVIWRDVRLRHEGDRGGGEFALWSGSQVLIIY